VVTDSKPYGFSPIFERVLAVALLSRPEVYGHIGEAIDPMRFTSGGAVALALRLAKLHAKEQGRGPSAAIIGFERARTLYQQGKLTHEELMELAELLADVHVLPSDSDILATATEVLRRDLQQQAILRAMDLHGARKDLTPALEELRRAAELGKQNRSTGLKLGLGAIDAIKRLRQADRLPFGLMDIDVQIGGGLPRGRAAIVAMAAKSGKSFWLTHVAGTTLVRGLFVAFATLENSEEEQSSRLLGWLTGELLDDITSGAADANVEAGLEVLAPSLGCFRVKFFPPKVTHFGHIMQWIEDIEEEEHARVDLLVVDYLDKMGSTNRAHDSEYMIQGQAAEDFRLYVHGRGMWGWTASQPKRRGPDQSKQRRIGIDDLADSQNKARAMDCILTGYRPSGNEIALWMAGSRFSKDQFEVGPFPTDLEHGRLLGVMPPGLVQLV
jgi:hypothetical protein